MCGNNSPISRLKLVDVQLENTNERILQIIDSKGFGLEIDPFENPVAPKSKGFKVEIVDYLSRADPMLSIPASVNSMMGLSLRM